MGSPMEIAATDDVQIATNMAEACAREAAAVGANWAFAPIIDIDTNFRNPITNTRTFGSDPARVRRMGEAYVKRVQELGLAASIKHFPGDGPGRARPAPSHLHQRYGLRHVDGYLWRGV